MSIKAWVQTTQEKLLDMYKCICVYVCVVCGCVFIYVNKKRIGTSSGSVILINFEKKSL